MKLSTFFVLAASSLALADDPSKCKAAEKKDAANFVLVDQGVNKHLAPLSKIFTNAKKRVNVSDVFNDGNHKMAGSAAKLSWEKTKDYNDMDTNKWVPQGISSTADALEVGTYDGKDGLLVSWYSDSAKLVRISFIDKKTNKYRNAVLVYPSADDDFKGVGIHAGGIMWYGDTLWVVDTYNGIRVFDMSNIWEVGSGDKVGKVSAGKYSAAGYKYVIPQKSWYKWTPKFEFRFSYIALDRTASPDRLMVGEYQKDDAHPKRLVQYELDATTRGLKVGADKKTAKAVWASCVNILRIQGAVQADKKIYISRSNGAKAGDLWGWVPGKGAHNNAGMLPTSPEDLSYDKRGKKIYGLTEAAGKRYVLTLDTSKVKFP